MRRGPKRSPLQREKDRAVIANLILEGKTQVEIARFLEVDASLISREVKAIRAEWKESTLVDFNEAKGKLVAELDRVKTELWASWHLSKEQQETTSIEKSGGFTSGNSQLTPARIKQLVRTQQKPGDPSYLSGVASCIKEQARLLGLYPQETTSGQSLSLTDHQLGVIGNLMREHEPS